ncbi:MULTISPECIES: GtrA family protein [Xanthomonas translucens group]|uniref:GtrA family protein n=1 Tax=Xanthomonas cerealis pv. cerealis TaxID=152263 RepID=A0A514EF78_9XANT|nr:GtrA family protein [Xanthomonas translucens]QDI04687.1 GtrA family protein [Xanthomonas translucens pv. cerealis]UKE46698.1 GtrA family protein [Xanthomonas translucens pv. cerealis]UKE69041.1 GtrA family protein [Xanthomonas translucens pv. pistacia]
MTSRKFIKFLLAGGTAAAANFGSRILLGQVMPYTWSIVVAYLIGMLTAFLLNRMFVFEAASTGLRHQAIWFTLINIAAVLQTLACSLILARWIFPAMGMRFHPETLAHAIGVAVPVFTSYFGHKALTFKERPA